MTTHVVAGKYVIGARDGAQALLRDHYVYVDGSKIEAVTRDAPAAGTPLVHYEHGLVMPGFVNLHAHCIRGGRAPQGSDRRFESSRYRGRPTRR